MSSNKSRSLRQERRALKFDRVLVTKDDLQYVIGKTLVEAIEYVNEKKLILVVKFLITGGEYIYNFSDDVLQKTCAGPNIIHVDMVEKDGNMVVGKACTTRRFV